ncbi:MAG TPA: tripartite tricarboxylate transporter TctB family protein [Methylomirabilota bacterium]|jgi:putative tricarboxylic transport membrane protein|nr:tripartite tricarboxylate transporter TctB family protein [Methylomirabilota bacterium]
MILGGNRAIGLGLALLGLVAIALASGFREGTATGGPGTRFLPVLVGVIVIVLGAAIALRPSASPNAATPLEPGGSRRGIWTLAAILGYVLLFERLGFVLASVPFLVVLLLEYGERRWPVVLAVALGATGATYGLFAVWLGVPLPPGPFGR